MPKPRTSVTSEAVKISCLPYGVGHDREGVCLLLVLGEYQILLDCGVADLSKLRQSESTIDFVLCSHAHRDHCRGLPQLIQAFPQIPIYTSAVTAQLLPLYWTEEIVTEIVEQITPLQWRSPIQLAENLELELFPAGHLPGAAVICLTYKTEHKDYKIVYTGDFSLSNFQLVEGLSIEQMRGLSPDVLIIEGSYGTVRHPHRRQQEKQLMERINLALMSGVNVLLPVAAIGMGQEILKLLRSHHQFTGRDLDIWVDSNIAKACNVYLDLLSQFPASVQNFAKHQSLFWDNRVCPRMQEITNKKDIFQGKLPCVAIVDRDEDLLAYVSAQAGKWLILFPENPHSSASYSQIARLYPLKKHSWITTETYLLAEHSDGRNTTQLIHNLRPQHIVLVHGLADYLLELASMEELCNRYQVHSPSNGKLLELPIGDRFIQPKKPAPTHHEGEINEDDTYITIKFPEHINQDSRWDKFADTGIVEARWQGDELVLRGISQKELLQPGHDASVSTDIDCCQSCTHYRSQRCWNQNSPLYGFKVIPEGYCPVFEPEV